VITHPDSASVIQHFRDKLKTILGTIFYRVTSFIRLQSMLAACVCCSILFSSNMHAAETNNAAEYAVKAAYIYNILRFVSWPDGHLLAQTDTVNICLLKQNPFKQYLEPIKSMAITGRSIRLKTIQSLKSSSDCHLIFFQQEEQQETPLFKQFIQSSDAILLGENIEFINDGGMFGFFIQNNKVKLGANRKAISNPDIHISALLLEVSQLFGEQQ